jgi:hypothetical protein
LYTLTADYSGSWRLAVFEIIVMVETREVKVRPKRCASFSHLLAPFFSTLACAFQVHTCSSG